MGSETATQRFRRESQEMWEQVQVREGIDSLSHTSPIKPIKPPPSLVKNVSPKETSLLFPKKARSSFVMTKPALWEKEEQKKQKPGVKIQEKKPPVIVQVQRTQRPATKK